MKRALLLSHELPPESAMWSPRGRHVCETLPNFGWEVVALTPDLTDGDAPMRKLLGVQWIGPSARAIARRVRDERFDAVISLSPPQRAHLIAARVHAEIPWIADVGDLAAMERSLQARPLRTARAITALCEPDADELRARHPNTPVYVVRDAYSRGDWESVAFEEPPYATLTCVGALSVGQRDPRLLFEATAQLLRDRLIRPEEIRIEFYCERSEWLTTEIRRYGIGGIVRLLGFKPQCDVRRSERRASRLLLFLWDNEREGGSYTGRFFEYLGARRRILAIGGPRDAVVDDLLIQSGAGERYRTLAGVRDAVMHTVTEWRTKRTAIVDENAVEPYELQHFGEAFAHVLERATAQDRAYTSA